MSTYFQSAKTAGIADSATRLPASFKLHGNQLAIIFNGEVKAEAIPQHLHLNQAWALQVIDIELPMPTRRPFKVRVNVDMHVLQGTASARLTVDGNTTSRQVRSVDSMKTFIGYLQLNLRRTTVKRDHIRVILWTESACKIIGGAAQAEIESFDIFTD